MRHSSRRPRVDDTSGLRSTLPALSFIYMEPPALPSDPLSARCLVLCYTVV